jgi:Ca-activated chloride channel family protein
MTLRQRALAVTLALAAASANAAGQVPAPASPNRERPRRVLPAPLLANSEVADPGDAGEELKLTTDLVLVSAVVTEGPHSDEAVKNLKASDFQVLDEGVPQQIEFFGDETLPLEVQFLFDASESLKFKQGFQREALASFLRGLLRPGDRGSVVWFSDRVHVEQDFTPHAEALVVATQRIPNGGPTALYEAVAQGADRMVASKGRRALVVLSDGRDTFSDTRLDQALKRAQAADVVIYGINTAFPSWSVTTEFRQNDPLEFLAAETGGEVFYAGQPEEVQTALALLSSRLRERYVLGFYPSGKRNGRFRRLSVRVNRKNARVIARTGYYAPAT